MKNKLVFFYLLLLAAGLSACTPFNVHPSSEQVLSWKDREARLNPINTWELQGKVAVQNTENSGSAALDWKQQNQQFTMTLSGPLGTTAFKLMGQPGLVILENEHGQRFTAPTLEQLLAQQTGFYLPVSSLYYWIRGLPVPKKSSQLEFDMNHRLNRLRQQGWDIQFLSYMTVGNIELPSKIFISSSALKAKIIIYQWTITH